jgi:hypothetical protein
MPTLGGVTLVGWSAAACLGIPIPEFTSLFYSDDETMLKFLRSVEADNGAALKLKYLYRISNLANSIDKYS